MAGGEAGLSGEIWTPLKLVSWTQGHFARSGVDAPRLTAELLLAKALGCDRLRLYLEFDKPVGPAELAAFRDLVKRRADGEPTAYLLGRKEFYGRTFRVDRRVLIPRPETELVVEVGLGALRQGGSVLDLCTGSGCIAVTVALERPDARVMAVEVSPDAASLARENAAVLGARVDFLEGDLYAPLAGGVRFDLVLANPPYAPSAELPGLAREIAREPALAIDGGADGLAIARRIVEGAPGRLLPGGTLVLEMHESHGEPLTLLCQSAGLGRVEVRRDLAGLPRLVVASMPA